MLRSFQQTDPADWAGIGAIVQKVTYTDSTITIGTLPAYSIVLQTIIARKTAWDAITTFQVGKSGDTDWLVGTDSAHVTGEAGDGEVISNGKMVTANTPVIVTLNQGAASAGECYVIVLFVEAAR